MVDPLLAFVIGMLVLVILAIKPFRFHVFVALILSALTIGILAGMTPVEALQATTGGLGGIVADAGMLIIFGIVLGSLLDKSGAARSLADKFISLIGKSRADLGIGISGMVSSIPIFSDAVYILLFPLVKRISEDNKIPIASTSVALASGALAAHVFVPPTPGPIVAASILGVDIGRLMLYGLIASIGMTLGGWAYGHYYLAKKYPDAYTGTDLRNAVHEKMEEHEWEEQEKEVIETEEPEQKKLPHPVMALSLILLPMALILMNTTADWQLAEGHNLLQYTGFFGSPNFALMISAGVAALLLRKYIDKEELGNVIGDSLKVAAPILFITGGGVAISNILKASGAGEAFAESLTGTGLPIILIAFVIGGLMKTATGSGTTAIVTSASLSVPFVEMGYSPLLIALAAGAGARLVCHLNDSFFWIFTEVSELDVDSGLRTLTVANVFMSGTAFIVVAILAALGVS